MNDLLWLLELTKNDSEKHEFVNGFTIETCDNPGWVLTVTLSHRLSQKYFCEIYDLRSEDDWIICSVKGDVFEGAGGSQNLSEIIKNFRNWIEEDIV